MNYIIFILFIVFIFYATYILFFKTQQPKVSTVINTIFRGKWAVASLQDTSPLVAILHANYAAAYLWALRDVFSDIDIQKTMDIDIIKYQKKIIDVQDRATQMLIKACPQYASNIDIYLGKISKEYTI